MRILFIARHFTYFRNYDSALRELARRGHAIHLAVELNEVMGGRQAVEALARECPAITYGEVPERAVDEWTVLSRRLRLGLDYLRYLDPFYDDAPLLRERARERTPNLFIRLAEPPLAGRMWRGLVAALSRQIDRAVPERAIILDYLREQRPDAMLITPLVELGSQQIDYLRAARQLGIPTALSVWSWDHLSSKAYIREYPERILVWNSTQQREATQVHGVPRDRVVVTGAQCFDHWFERRPSRTREEFCSALGLPADRPLVLYVCTGLIMGSPPEPPFVREWLQRLRASHDHRVATAGVLVRPHPGRMSLWRDVDLSALGPVAIWGGNPVDEQSRADYFDSLYYSGAVVGLNTSAFIEAGIVGREVLAILPPQFYDNQEGTVHFRYLLEIGGGLLRVSRDFDTHLAQLSAALARPPSVEHPHRAFLEAFVRPGGWGEPATPVFVRAVEELATCRVAAVPSANASRSAWRRRLLERLNRMMARPDAERWVLAPRELESLSRTRAAAAAKAERHLALVREKNARRQRLAEDRVRQSAEREQVRARRQAGREAEQAARLREKASLNEARRVERLREREAALASKRAHRAERRARIDAERAAARRVDVSSS